MLKKFIENFEEIIATGFLIVTISLVLINIITRYFLNTGVYWSEEVATACFVWTVYISGAAAFKRGRHIGIDILVHFLNTSAQKIVKIIIDILLIAVISFMAYISIQYILASYTKVTPVLTVSSAWISVAMPIGFILMVIRGFEALYYDCRALKNKEGINAQ